MSNLVHLNAVMIAKSGQQTAPRHKVRRAGTRRSGVTAVGDSGFAIRVERRSAALAAERFAGTIVPGFLEFSDRCGKKQPRCESDGEFASVVSVELQFRQQIACSNAKKRSGGERERRPQEQVADLRKLARTEVKQQHTKRDGQREQSVDQMAR